MTLIGMREEPRRSGSPHGINVQFDAPPETIDIIEDVSGTYEVVESVGVVSTVQVEGPRKHPERLTFVTAPTIRRQWHVNGVLVEERAPVIKQPAKGQQQTTKPYQGGKR